MFSGFEISIDFAQNRDAFTKELRVRFHNEFSEQALAHQRALRTQLISQELEVKGTLKDTQQRGDGT